MKKSYPLEGTESLFQNPEETFRGIGVKINPSLEGINVTEDILNEPCRSSKKKLLSLEFNWLPKNVVEEYNSRKTEYERKKTLVEKVYGNCKLNCKGCYVKQDNLFKSNNLISPEDVLKIIEEAVNELGTKTVKYLGPSEFFRDKDVFDYLDKLQKIGVVINIFVKDPMFGDDEEVKKLFGDKNINTSEELIEKLSSYENLRMLFNFRSFDEDTTNDLVRGGYNGKSDYQKNYKSVQNRALKLLYNYFCEKEIKKGKASRLIIVNTPITSETIGEALEIFKYFLDRGVPVISTTSMQSGCGGKIYNNLNSDFLKKFEQYYIETIKYSLSRGVISKEYIKKYGPSPYAGMNHCFQLCNGLLIRETGQLMRCPGADHNEWQDSIKPEELLEKGVVWAWSKTINYNEESRINVGCLAKPKIFTKELNKSIQSQF